MLALDAIISGLDPTAWRNLSRLLLPPPPPADRQRPRPPRRPPLVLFVERGRVVQALRPGPRPSLADHQAELLSCASLWHGPASLRAVRHAAGARWLAVIEDDGLELLARAVEGRIHQRDDLLAQGLAAAEALREQLGRQIHLDPNPFALGLPRPDQVSRVVDLLLPDERALVLYIVDTRGETAPLGEAAGPRVFTSLILAKRRGQISQVTTHLSLGHLSAPSHDLRRDARQMSQAVQARIAQPHLGIYITLQAWRGVVGPQPGALAKAVALGEAVLEPVPAWMMAITGLGAATGLAEGAGRLLGRYLPKGMMDLAKQVGMSPFQAVGIDPLQLWNRITGLARGEE